MAGPSDLLFRGPAAPATIAPVELVVAILRCGGIPPEHTGIGKQLLPAAERSYAATIANETADACHRDTEALVALTSPEQFPYLSEAAAQPRQDPQAAFEFGLRAIAIGLLGGQGAVSSTFVEGGDWTSTKAGLARGGGAIAPPPRGVGPRVAPKHASYPTQPATEGGEQLPAILTVSMCACGDSGPSLRE